MRYSIKLQAPVIHFSASGCSENCKPILARNNLEIIDKHSAEFERNPKLVYSLHVPTHVSGT